MIEDILIFSVYEVTRHLKQVIESSIEPMYICGEISNFTHHSSGHMYFNLKDPNATIRCTFFRNLNSKLDFKPEDGMQVVCFGGITIFEKTGQYNLNVQSMQIQGQGDMARRFEQLKQKLSQEGLFDQDHKQPIPKFPERIGIITSPTGAALQDIRNILTRRFPVEVLVFPALVQGNEAPAQLRDGIRYFNDQGYVDVIILTRGGGSQEDLWCFNDEALAREIYASKIPLISAVGHEIDFSISDLVADLRAPTPSAAAELVVPDKADIMIMLNAYRKRLDIFSENSLNHFGHLLTIVGNRLEACSPQATLNVRQQMLDHLQDSLESGLSYLDTCTEKINLISERYAGLLSYRLSSRLTLMYQRLENDNNTMSISLDRKFGSFKERLALAEAVLGENSPGKTLSRGYSIISHEGKIVKSVKDIKPGNRLELQFADGQAPATVDELPVKKT
ncbi:MAG TPA: exodeoxyribonuclease VII large subunit [Candidatus Cloacimonadota bacterium]|nr:exodeoxyribonuclease VII large subunit [Candidatus Cloacimonadota bacterium]